MKTDKAVEIIEQLFDLFKKRYENHLEWMKGSDFDLQLCSVIVS